MHFTFIVEIDVEREQGKFATRDELREQLQQALDDANPGELTGESEGQYNVASWEVTEQEQPKPTRKSKHKRTVPVHDALSGMLVQSDDAT